MKGEVHKNTKKYDGGSDFKVSEGEKIQDAEDVWSGGHGRR